MYFCMNACRDTSVVFGISLCFLPSSSPFLSLSSTSSTFTSYTFKKRLPYPPVQPRQRRCLWTLQSTTGDESTDPPDQNPPNQSREQKREAYLNYLSKISLYEPQTGPFAIPKNTTERQAVLPYLLTSFVPDLNNSFEKLLQPIWCQLLAGSFALTFGFFAAVSASLVFGAISDWDPLAAAVLLVWTELYTKFYYRTKKKTSFLKLVNAFKIGVTYGMVVDALKLCN